MTMDHGQLEHAQIVGGKFLVSHCDAPILLKPSHAAFDHIALAICVAIEFQWTAPIVRLLVYSLRNGRINSMPAQGRGCDHFRFRGDRIVLKDSYLEMVQEGVWHGEKKAADVGGGPFHRRPLASLSSR